MYEYSPIRRELWKCGLNQVLATRRRVRMYGICSKEKKKKKSIGGSCIQYVSTRMCARLKSYMLLLYGSISIASRATAIVLFCFVLDCEIEGVSFMMKRSQFETKLYIFFTMFHLYTYVVALHMEEHILLELAAWVIPVYKEKMKKIFAYNLRPIEKQLVKTMEMVMTIMANESRQICCL